WISSIIIQSVSANNVRASCGRPTSIASMDSGVINTIQFGFFNNFFFLDELASPCQLVTVIPISLHKDIKRLNWSLIRAMRGEIYTIRTPVSQSSILFIAGKKAASVFPEAVGAAITKLFVLSWAKVIAFF